MMAMRADIDCEKHITSDCPFCTETESLYVMEEISKTHGHRFHYVECGNCGARGPTRIGAEVAARAFSEGLEGE
jgi:transcription elongation factor Elf1